MANPFVLSILTTLVSLGGVLHSLPCNVDRYPPLGTPPLGASLPALIPACAVIYLSYRW